MCITIFRYQITHYSAPPKIHAHSELIHFHIYHALSFLSLLDNFSYTNNHENLMVPDINVVLYSVIFHSLLFIIIFSFEEKYILGYTFPNPCVVSEYATYSLSIKSISFNSSLISEFKQE